MAEQGTLAINDNVVKFAGANANSTYTAEAFTNVYIKCAEGLLCGECGTDFVTNYSSITTIGKELLRIAVASKAAQLAVQASTNNYLSPSDALLQLNFLDNQYIQAREQIKKSGDKLKFIGAT